MTIKNNLTIQFAVEKLRRELQLNPEKAIDLAINYFEDWLVLSAEYQQLNRQYQAVMHDNQLLTEQIIDTPPRLPSFLSCQKH